MNFYSHFFVVSPQRYKRVTSPGVQLGILKARGGYPNLLFFLSGFFFTGTNNSQDSRTPGKGVDLVFPYCLVELMIKHFHRFTNIETFICSLSSEMSTSCFLMEAFFLMRSPYHIETSPLVCSANQCNGFYMIETSVMKVLIVAHVIARLLLDKIIHLRELNI